MSEWISVKERTPHVEDDFQTFAEHQQTSEKVLVKLKPPTINLEDKTDVIDGYFVVKEGVSKWCLDEHALGPYYHIDLVTHWQPIEPPKE